jgi:putative effector of murein hydrolase LrgA (UPF0299 family)
MGSKLDTRASDTQNSDTHASNWRSVLLQALSTLVTGVVSGVLTQYLCEWLAKVR